MWSLIYVSRPLIEARNRARVLDDIQAASIARNTTLGITGLLITTPDYFAQLLEGPRTGIEAVMASIRADPRHYDLRIIRQAPITKPRFPLWRMARFDSDRFESLGTDPLLAACHAGDDADATARLDRLIDTIAGSRIAVHQH